MSRLNGISFFPKAFLKTNNKSEIIAGNRKRLLNSDTPFAIREAYNKLRTGLMFCMTKEKDRACKTIAVTSANPSEGKSLTAANIAISYAMLGKRTLLIDADLRKPTQRRLWKLDASVGFCDFIAGIWKLELVKVKDFTTMGHWRRNHTAESIRIAFFG